MKVLRATHLCRLCDRLRDRLRDRLSAQCGQWCGRSYSLSANSKLDSRSLSFARFSALRAMRDETVLSRNETQTHRTFTSILPLNKYYSQASQFSMDSRDKTREEERVGDKEQMEKERQREKQQKMMKYTLLMMCSMSGGFVLYALWQWGRPAVDDDGNQIVDRFSELSLPEQYVKRTWSTLWDYNQVLREPTRALLLPPPLPYPYQQPPYTLVLEMTGVLVHPEWTYKTGWRFKKRPYVDYFLQQCATSGLFEIVIYTYEQGFTAFPLIDSLDPNGFVMYRLFRDSTRYENGTHQKDLNCLNRDLSRVIHVDWNAKACQLNTSNCFTLKKWNGDSDDRTLYDLAHFLRAIATEGVQDVRDVIMHYSQFDEPLETFKDNQRKLALQEKEKEQQNITSSLSKSIINSLKRK